MHKEAREELRVRLQLVVLELAHHFGVTEACREFKVPGSSFSRWKHEYEKEGRSGLYREKLIADRHPCRTSPEVVEKILAIRAEYVLSGPLSWDQDFRIQSEPSLESPWIEPAAQDRSPMYSADPTV